MSTELGLQVRTGIHTGECERLGERLSGIAVHIGARVAEQAGPGEVLVSQTVKDLVVGSGIAFVDRGCHGLKGVSGTWELYAVAGEIGERNSGHPSPLSASLMCANPKGQQGSSRGKREPGASRRARPGNIKPQ